MFNCYWLSTWGFDEAVKHVLAENRTDTTASSQSYTVRGGYWLIKTNGATQPACKVHLFGLWLLYESMNLKREYQKGMFDWGRMGAMADLKFIKLNKQI